MKRITKKDIAENIARTFYKIMAIKNQTSEISMDDFIYYLSHEKLVDLHDFWIPKVESEIESLDDTERLVYECMD